MVAPMEPREVPVLISGGGLVGLSAAMFLAQHGIPSLVVERLTAPSPLPRAAFFHMRTLELFRECGIEDEVREAIGTRVRARRRRGGGGIARRATDRRVHSQPERRRGRAQPLPPTVRHPAAGSSPFCAAAPNGRARACWAGTNSLRAVQDEGGVAATVRNVETGEERASPRAI